MVGLIYFMIFFVSAIFELKNSYANSFVLFTISAVFLKGVVTKKDGYCLAGSILGLAFGVLMILSAMASYADTFLGGEDANFSYGIVGISTLPYLLMMKRRLSA
ncbi:hypothetical protein [Archaeoglobus profundus]|uniref:Uncharacterized protein n=1 Tax=Archaeoglobus profundus (strain DSM 5631 / JCM 9629 / NBRC 100127 / Av18) TaxID=572546 RepID=D2RFZ7_ARCPA|nr:hypothetical protein [Archaeoglobus profundus]ADB57222.1 hypothetical protein Arcpr_0150 [Archaeoglobus profundus DSM 5631]